MSTRCNVVLKVGKTVTYLYRHWDGYPAETGADVLVKVEEALGTPEQRYSTTGAAGRLLRALLTACESETPPHRSEPRRHYDLTDNLHGDVEHVYFITFDEKFNTGKVSIKHAERPKDWSSNDDEVEDWTRKAKRYSVENFRQLVNADRMAINERIAKLRAEQPKAYGDVADYQLV